MHIKIDPRWDFKNEKHQTLHEKVIPLLAQINRRGKLTAAAKACAVSYRHAWSLLNAGGEFFGAPLVVMEKGRGAKLSRLGEKLLWTSQRVEARLQPEMESFATELNVELQRSLSADAPVIKIFASHGYAVALMMRYFDRARVEIYYHAPEHALIALNENRCRLAGFHQPIDMEIPRQRARYRELLPPGKFGLIRFIRRQQGLIFHPAIRPALCGIDDLRNGHLKFINRQPSSGTRVLLEQLLRERGIEPGQISGYENQEFTHSAVAAHIAAGIADVGFGVRAAAERFGLNFALAAEEYYLWAYPLQAEQDPDIQAFIAMLRDPKLQAQINRLPGYRCEHCGVTVSPEWLFP